MYTIKNKISALLVLLVLFMFSCHKLKDMNINPNGVDPATADPNLLMATVITSTGLNVVNLGFGDIAGVMQHTQLDGWSSGHNDYNWTNNDWSGYYSILNTDQQMILKAESSKLDFTTAVGLIFKAYNFGYIADLWGDAPYSQALLGTQGSTHLLPAFDTQQAIYAGILATLDSANTLLSKDPGSYATNPTQDVLYGGNVTQWRKFANSLALRYYLRISEKEPSIARAGFEKIAGNPDKYPLTLNASDDASFAYIGNNSGTAWPSNLSFTTDSTNFTRIQMCQTLVGAMVPLSDPRLGVWAAKVRIPLQLDPNQSPTYDQVVNGVEVIGSQVAANYSTKYFNTPLNYDQNYVGIPPSWAAFPQLYNLAAVADQGVANPHVSQLNNIYAQPSGPLLKARLLSAAEVQFGLAEAAFKGWSVGGTAAGYYNAGIKASFDTWGLSSSFATYITNPGVPFNGTLSQIMEQKWIASWTAAAEAWFDYRRTGLPAFVAGPNATRPALPLRFIYGLNELQYNAVNTNNAITNTLVQSPYTSSDGNNSAWSKTWLLQGTNMPY